jgi:prolyl 4-hydroxylase
LLVTIAVSSVRAPLGAGRPGASRMPLSARRRRASALVALLALCSPPLASSAAEHLPGWHGDTYLSAGATKLFRGGAAASSARAADSADGVGSASARLASASASASASDRLPALDPLDDPEDADGGGLPAPGTIHVDPSRVQHLSWSPRAYLYRGFLRRAECEYIVQNSTPRLKKSTVVDNETGKSVDSTIRTSEGTFFSRQQDEVIADIERRIAEWSHVPVDNGEGIQVLRYRVGQEYRPHMDAFSDAFNQAEDKGGQRVATVLMYLTDVEEGGETVFPYTTEKPHAGDAEWSECARKGVAVKPRAGDALLFFSMDNARTLDQKSTHAGCPVIRGEKWSATKWMHVGSFAKGHKMDFGDPSVCDDENENCEEWASKGECENNPNYMTGLPKEDGFCMRACGKCPEGSKRAPGKGG